MGVEPTRKDPLKEGCSSTVALVPCKLAPAEEIESSCFGSKPNVISLYTIPEWRHDTESNCNGDY